MKPASVNKIKEELSLRSHGELLELCLQLSKFKKENKELLSYLLYDAADEPAYIESVKDEITSQFKLINTSSYYYIKKSVRKILRMVKKYIRYSKKKETEVELMLYFCTRLKKMHPTMEKSTALHNIFKQQIEAIKKAIATLHADLQYDYELELEELF